MEEKKVGIFKTRIERQKIQSLSEVEEKKIGIYIVYMGFYRRSSTYGSTTYTTTVGLFIVVVVVHGVLL